MPKATAHPHSIEIHEAAVRVEAVRRIVEHDIVLGDGSLDADTTWWIADMLGQAARWLQVAA